MVDIHHYLGLCIRFQYIQDINAHNCVEISSGVFRTIIAIIPRNIISLPSQFIRIETKATSEIKYPPLQQTMLKQITSRGRQTRSPNSRQIGMIYLYRIHRFNLSKFQIPYSTQSGASA